MDPWSLGNSIYTEKLSICDIETLYCFLKKSYYNQHSRNKICTQYYINNLSYSFHHEATFHDLIDKQTTFIVFNMKVITVKANQAHIYSLINVLPDIYFPITNRKQNKTGVINDPLGQTHSLASSEHCFRWEVV